MPTTCSAVLLLEQGIGQHSRHFNQLFHQLRLRQSRALNSTNRKSKLGHFDNLLDNRRQGKAKESVHFHRLFHHPQRRDVEGRLLNVHQNAPQILHHQPKPLASDGLALVVKGEVLHARRLPYPGGCRLAAYGAVLSILHHPLVVLRSAGGVVECFGQGISDRHPFMSPP